jgi:hypothetical protein
MGLGTMLPTYSHTAVVTGSVIMLALGGVILAVFAVRWWLRR